MPDSTPKFDQTNNRAGKMVKMSAYCVSAIIAASLLLSCAGMHHPPTTVSQEPFFECTNVIGAEPFGDLVKRVVSVAENQAFLTSQSVPPEAHPVSVLPNGTWETQKPGMQRAFLENTMHVAYVRCCCSCLQLRHVSQLNSCSTHTSRY